MKKIIYWISALALMFLVNSCEEKEGTLFDFGGKDYVSFQAEGYSFVANDEGKNVVYLYHLSDGPSSTFSVSVDAHGAEDLFSVSPTQITFDKNSNKATIEIKYNKTDLDLLTPYVITLSIPEQDYPVEGSVIETQEIMITYEPVWEHYADGSFVSQFFDGDEWDQEILKGVGMEVYKLPSLYVNGVDFVFRLDDETTGEVSIPGVTPNADGLYRWETGYRYGSYGLVWGLLDPDPNYSWFDKVNKNANFNSLFRVTAGTFDWYNESLTW